MPEIIQLNTGNIQMKVSGNWGQPKLYIDQNGRAIPPITSMEADVFLGWDSGMPINFNLMFHSITPVDYSSHSSKEWDMSTALVINNSYPPMFQPTLSYGKTQKYSYKYGWFAPEEEFQSWGNQWQTPTKNIPFDIGPLRPMTYANPFVPNPGLLSDPRLVGSVGIWGYEHSFTPARNVMEDLTAPSSWEVHNLLWNQTIENDVCGDSNEQKDLADKSKSLTKFVICKFNGEDLKRGHYEPSSKTWVDEPDEIDYVVARPMSLWSREAGMLVDVEETKSGAAPSTPVAVAAYEAAYVTSPNVPVTAAASVVSQDCCLDDPNGGFWCFDFAKNPSSGFIGQGGCLSGIDANCSPYSNKQECETECNCEQETPTTPTTPTTQTTPTTPTPTTIKEYCIECLNATGQSQYIRTYYSTVADPLRAFADCDAVLGPNNTVSFDDVAMSKCQGGVSNNPPTTTTPNEPEYCIRCVYEEWDWDLNAQEYEDTVSNINPNENEAEARAFCGELAGKGVMSVLLVNEGPCLVDPGWPTNPTNPTTPTTPTTPTEPDCDCHVYPTKYDPATGREEDDECYIRINPSYREKEILTVQRLGKPKLVTTHPEIISWGYPKGLPLGNTGYVGQGYFNFVDSIDIIRVNGQDMLYLWAYFEDTNVEAKTRTTGGGASGMPPGYNAHCVTICDADGNESKGWILFKEDPDCNSEIGAPGNIQVIEQETTSSSDPWAGIDPITGMPIGTSSTLSTTIWGW